MHLFAFSESCFICSWSRPFRVRRSVISNVLALSSEVLFAHITGFLFWYASPIAANRLKDARVGFSVSLVRRGGSTSSPGTNSIVFGMRWVFISWVRNSSISSLFNASVSDYGGGGGLGSVE